MRWVVRSLAFGLALVCVYTLAARAADDTKAQKAIATAPERVLWTTSKIVGSPDPPSPYRIGSAFPRLRFDEPLDITCDPASGRLYVVERYGKIFSFPNDQSVSIPQLALDLNQVLGRKEPKSLAAYAIELHPKFAENGFLYVTYVPDPAREEPKGTRVSRFRVLADDHPPICDPESEQIMIEWPSGGHNGGCLKFGPDGMLYIATGDSSGIADEYLTGQNLASLAGKILRVDVDHLVDNRASAPMDNPFVGHEGAKPEIWAYGLRQPWRMSFNRATGDFWVGNVGQDLWEQIYLVERGGNYGWSVLEGSHPFRPERQRGPSPILMPVVEHDHANFRSITGGFVYRGKRLSDLAGAYIYGDYDTGRIWMLRYDRAKKAVTENRELVDSSLRLIGFAEDAHGELFLLDHMSGKLHLLVPNPAAKEKVDFPRRLSETGLFASTRDHKMAPGIIPYHVIAPQWIDGASKERYLGLPGTSQIEFEAIIYPQPAPGAPGGWKFPNGAVLAETIFLEMEAGNPSSRRRLETRILHNERLLGGEDVGDQYWQGYTYVWNDEQTDAVLLEDPLGLDRTFSIRDASAPGGTRQQTWRFPSRAECTVCHNMAAKYVLGMQTLQVNRDGGHVAGNQLARFEALGLFTAKLPEPAEKQPKLVDYHDATLPVAGRARSYLHANCSHCHRKWGGGNAEFQLLATIDTGDMGIVGIRPGQGAFNLPAAHLVTPSDPYRSVLYYRAAKLGPGRMPRLGSNVVDPLGVRLIHDWIAQLPATGAVASTDGRSRRQTEAEVDALRKAAGEPAAAIERRIEPLLASTSASLILLDALLDPSFPTKVRETVARRAAALENAEVRDLFEQFLPEEQRIKRLGTVVRPEQILAIPGDGPRGKKLFFEAQGLQCRNCHRIGGVGQSVGPDLDQIGKKYQRAEILENILDPSKRIEEKYLTYVIETKEGELFTGIVVEKDAKKVVLRDANNKTNEILLADVERLASQQKSIMPDLLLREMTLEQVADLTAYLSSLK